MCFIVAAFNGAEQTRQSGKMYAIGIGWELYFHTMVITFLISVCIVFVTCIVFGESNVRELPFLE